MKKTKRGTTHSRDYSKRPGAHYNLLSLKDGRDVMELARGVLDVNGAFYPLPAEYPDNRLTVKALDGEMLIYFPASFIQRQGIVLSYR